MIAFTCKRWQLLMPQAGDSNDCGRNPGNKAWGMLTQLPQDKDCSLHCADVCPKPCMLCTLQLHTCSSTGKGNSPGGSAHSLLQHVLSCTPHCHQGHQTQAAGTSRPRNTLLSRCPATAAAAAHAAGRQLAAVLATAEACHLLAGSPRRTSEQG